MLIRVLYQTMALDDMLTTAILAVVNIFFIAMICLIHNKDRNKHNGLSGWIIGASMQVFSTLIFVIRDLITNDTLKTIVTFIGNILLLASYVVMLKHSLKIIGRKGNMRNWALAIIGMTLALFYATVITYNGVIITTVVLFLVVSTNLFMIFAIYYNKTKQQRSRWLGFVVLNGLALFFVMSYALYYFIVRGLPVDSLLLYDSQNILLKMVVMLSTTNAIGLFVTFNSAAPSYIDLENELFSGMFYNVPFMVVAVDAISGLITYTNPSFLKQMGYSRNEVIGKLQLKSIHYSDDEYNRVRKAYFANGNLSNEDITFYTKNKEKLHGLLSVTPMLFEEGVYLIGSIINISSMVSQKETFKNMALFDDLTKLPNRRPLRHNFNLKVKDNNPFLVVIIDLDNFKQLNDTYGHLYGDYVLRAIAQQINIFNKGTDIVSRYGGDEFVLILSLDKKADIPKMIDKILYMFKSPFNIKGDAIKVDASVGFACFPKDGKTLETLISKADKALYKAKRKNNVFAKKYLKKD